MGASLSSVKQKIHFCLISSAEFLPARSQFLVPEISRPLFETLFDVSGTFDVCSIENQQKSITIGYDWPVSAPSFSASPSRGEPVSLRIRFVSWLTKA